MASLNQSEKSSDRYQRIRQLGWDPEILSKAHILVVGAGALGNEVLKNLALLGVGFITVVDMDSIESHNLTRSVLFRSNNVGQPKAQVAAERVREINPEGQVRWLASPVQNVLGLGAYRRFDVVLGCLDNAQARYDVGRSCWQTGTLFIDAGLDYLNGDVRVFQPPDTACYACTLQNDSRETMGNRHRCLQIRYHDDRPSIPTAPTIAAIAAGWQTQIAIKYLHGASIPAGRRLGLYGLSDEPFQYAMSPNADCIDSGRHGMLKTEQIIATDFSVGSCTPKALLEFAKEQLSDYGEYAVLDLGFDFVEFAECSNCGSKKNLHRRIDRIFVDEVSCCGEIMDLRKYYLLGEQDPLANLTFADLGVPPLDLILVKDTHHTDSGKWIYRYFEMGGDHTVVFGSMPVSMSRR